VGEWAQSSMIGSGNSFFGTASDPSLQSFCKTTWLTAWKVWNIFLIHKLPPSSVWTRPQYLAFDESQELNDFREKYAERWVSTWRDRDLWHHPIHEAARWSWLNVRWIDDESKIVPVYNRVDGIPDSLVLDDGRLRAALGYHYQVDDLLSGKRENVNVWIHWNETIEPRNLLRNYPEKSWQIALFDDEFTKNNVHFADLQWTIDEKVEQLLGLYNAAIFRRNAEREYLIWTGPDREDLQLMKGRPLRRVA